MVLMVAFSSRISPFTSTVIFCDRSPLATAVVTLAMLRTWEVRFAAMKFTLSVRSFQTPDTPRTSAWPPSLPSVPTSRATRVTSEAKLRSWSTMVLMVAFSSRISPFTSTVIFCDRSPLATAVVTLAMLRTWEVRFAAMKFTLSVRSFQIPDTPRTSAWPPSLPPVPTSRATRVDRDLLGQVAVRDRGGHLGDVAHLVRQVAGEDVHVVREVLPGAREALHVSLHAQLPVGAHLASDARHLPGEGAELIDHGVDGVLQLQDLALHVDGDLLRQIAVGDSRGDLRDVAHLRGQVRRHQIHVVGEVLPTAGHSGHFGLGFQLALDADRAGDVDDLLGEDAQRLGHVVERLAKGRDLASRLYHPLLVQVAVRHRRDHLDDAAHLGGQVRGHEVHVVGEVLPDAADAAHLRLATQLAFGADLAGDARDLGGK